MIKLVGLLTITFAVFGGFYAAGGNIATVWQPAEFVIILGAALGALLVANPTHVIKEMLVQLRAIARAKPNEKELYLELIGLMRTLLETIRAKGIKSVDDHIDTPQDSSLFQGYPLVLRETHLIEFITDNVRLLSIGQISSHEIEAMLEQEIMAIEGDLKRPSKSLAKIADACPGFGILAAVLGIIITMGHIDSSITEVGVKVAAALVGTFAGIFLCYCFFEPLSSAMAMRVERDISALECVKSILVAYVASKPIILACDAGRKSIQLDAKPSFAHMEKWLEEHRPNTQRDAA